MTTITAQTILRSRHAQRPDKVLSTLLLRYPRWIHAEGKTHRALSIDEDFEIEVRTPDLMADPNLSRNAGSSRATPVSKLIQDVIDNPALPIFWGLNQRGMQATEECNERVDLSEVIGIGHSFSVSREDAWLAARDYAVALAKAFAKAGYHKQVVNRLLEPFSHITVLVSATEWSNFLALRDHADAEPHIAMLAREIRKELDREDNIQTKEPGQWHLPFITDADWDTAISLARPIALSAYDRNQQALNMLIKKSVACCASTSYKTVDGFEMTMERAIELHDKLVGATPLHASPAEHVAQADVWVDSLYEGEFQWDHTAEHGNFVGFRQYRKMLPGESQ